MCFKKGKYKCKDLHEVISYRPKQFRNPFEQSPQLFHMGENQCNILFVIKTLKFVRLSM